ncbi:hypothetical protein GCM10023206_07400 [Acinetobacter puyangensis]|uniref:Uncharacterized protein n=1 Tax=Acinetobacter puyangensis TaxID=1096779 RepID=A0A240E8H8_9GAMM|nr:hypothetical protein [Acinetobacter puyangensis]SNX44180.1 hypothetical protein SAMN05421731_102341 [Acinetobacter puyangensis]
MKSTDHTQFIDDIDGGVFAQQLGYAISEVASAVVDNDKAGEITIKLKLTKGVGANSVTIDHKLTSIAPLADGRKLEDHGAKTSMYVNKDGDVTLFANHTAQLFEENA